MPIGSCPTFPPKPQLIGFGFWDKMQDANRTNCTSFAMKYLVIAKEPCEWTGKYAIY
jgi:hypothetical protein